MLERWHAGLHMRNTKIIYHELHSRFFVVVFLSAPPSPSDTSAQLDLTLLAHLSRRLTGELIV